MKIIGIAGGTAGGKSTFTEKLRRSLCESGVRVKTVHMDGHFKEEGLRPFVPSHLSGKKYIDDNCPDTIDWNGFHKEFDDAACGGEYDVIIAEGLLVLWDEYLRDKLNLRVFVDCRADERIVRRISRNMSYGQGFDQITGVYLDMVRFRHDQYVEPTKWTADIIVNGAGNTDAARDMIISYLNSIK